MNPNRLEPTKEENEQAIAHMRKAFEEWYARSHTWAILQRTRKGNINETTRDA